MSQPSYFMDPALLLNDFRVGVVLLIVAWCKADTYVARATTPNRHTSHDRYDSATPASIPASMFVSARVIVPVRIISPVSLCPHRSLLVLSLCVLWLASPIYNPADPVSYDHQSIPLRAVLELHSSDCLARTTDSYIAPAPIPSTFPRYHRTVPNRLASALVPHFLNLARLRLSLGTTSL